MTARESCSKRERGRKKRRTARVRGRQRIGGKACARARVEMQTTTRI